MHHSHQHHRDYINTSHNSKEPNWTLKTNNTASNATIPFYGEFKRTSTTGVGLSTCRASGRSGGVLESPKRGETVSPPSRPKHSHERSRAPATSTTTVEQGGNERIGPGLAEYSDLLVSTLHTDVNHPDLSMLLCAMGQNE